MIYVAIATTGLDPAVDHVIEIAACAGDPPRTGTSGVAQWPRGIIARGEHVASRLLDECVRSSMSSADLLYRFAEWYHAQGDQPWVGWNAPFIRAFVPCLPTFTIDLATLRLAREAAGLPACPITGAPRCEAKALAAIGALRWHLSRIIP